MIVSVLKTQSNILIVSRLILMNKSCASTSGKYVRHNVIASP